MKRLHLPFASCDYFLNATMIQSFLNSFLKKSNDILKAFIKKIEIIRKYILNIYYINILYQL